MLFLALAEGTLRSPILLLSLQELRVVLVGQKRMRCHNVRVGRDGAGRGAREMGDDGGAQWVEWGQGREAMRDDGGCVYIMSSAARRLRTGPVDSEPLRREVAAPFLLPELAGV